MTNWVLKITKIDGELGSLHFAGPHVTSSLLLGLENESENQKLRQGLNERFLNKNSKKGHNLYLKINTSRDISKSSSKNDVIDDVIGHKKSRQISKIFGSFERGPFKEQMILLQKSLNFTPQVVIRLKVFGLDLQPLCYLGVLKALTFYRQI